MEALRTPRAQDHLIGAVSRDGYLLVEHGLPDGTALRESFNTLVEDQYYTNGRRLRRFAQYRLTHSQGRWRPVLLPHRPFIQSRAENSLAGGIFRHLQPLISCPIAHIVAGALAIPLDTGRDWQINVHQFRIFAHADHPVACVPEGPHQDGHDYAMLYVGSRTNIRGAVTQLFTPHSPIPIFSSVLEPGYALLIDDTRLIHYTTDINPINPLCEAFRDALVVVFADWEHRRYGPNFEQRALDNKIIEDL